jgi:fucose permease
MLPGMHVRDPYSVMLIILIFTSLGVSNLARHNEVLGILHACYGLGATLSPLIATAMITKAGKPWWTFYYLMVSMAVTELLLGGYAFRNNTGAGYRAENPRTEDERGAKRVMKEALWTMPFARTVWIGTVFLFLYLGVEVALGGWIVTFMNTQRAGSPFASGMAAVGFWLGLTVGRVILGFVTPRIGEKTAVLVYIPITMALELIFWLVPQFYVSAVAVAFQGFFIGPLFPAVVVVITRILPRHIHVFAIGVAAAAGGAGAAVFPFIVGAIAESSPKGVRVLQPVVLSLLGGLFLLWIALPKMNKKRE